MAELFNESLKTYRIKIDELVRQLHDLTVKIGHEEMATTVSDLRNRIKEPYMFVIVGEVKAGKSSFVNALLGADKEICKVAPQPMTDTIQQIMYGEKEEIVEINEHLKKIYQPIDILKEVAIVDTPGTNAIVENHQEITERFIPASDMIVFVFESKNPYRQSAWQFFDYIHEDWRKKIVFVLQQKDLMNEGDLRININGVREHAEKKGIFDPKVFAVSAKMELDGLTESSGFVEVKKYINDNITGGRAPVLKLQNNIKTSKNINEKIYQGVLDRKQQNIADKEFRLDIRETLDDQEVKSNKQVDVLVENLLNTYDSITRKTGDELKNGLSFTKLIRRSFSSIFTKDTSAKEWLDGLSTNFENELNTSLKAKLEDGVVDLAESIQQMAKIIDLKIQNSQLAAIGLILTALTNGLVFDITGGILTTIGLLFAGVTVGLKRKKIIADYNVEIAKGRIRLEREVTEKLKNYVTHIKNRIDANFSTFDEMVTTEGADVKALEDMHLKLDKDLDDMGGELVQLL